MRAKGSCVFLLAFLALPLSAGVAASQQSGALTGTVVGANKSPLRNAHARLLGTQLQAVTDGNGAFRLPEIMTGKYSLEIRMLGYAAKVQSIEIVSGETIDVSMELSAAAVELDTVSVTAAPNPHLQGFEERRSRGQGRYFTRDQITKMSPRGLSDVLRRVPGFQLQAARNSDGFSVQTGRTGTRVCPVLYYLNGSPFPISADMSINTFVDPDAVEAMEVYAGASQIPPQFNSAAFNARCGVVVIWTRMGRDQAQRRQR